MRIEWCFNERIVLAMNTKDISIIAYFLQQKRANFRLLSSAIMGQKIS